MRRAAVFLLCALGVVHVAFAPLPNDGAAQTKRGSAPIKDEFEQRTKDAEASKAIVAEFVKARTEAAQQLEGPTADIRHIQKVFSEQCIAIIRKTFVDAEELIDTPGAAAVAGSMARHEMCPFSDIDMVWILPPADGGSDRSLDRSLDNAPMWWESIRSRLRMGDMFRESSMCPLMSPWSPKGYTSVVAAPADLAKLIDRTGELSWGIRETIYVYGPQALANELRNQVKAKLGGAKDALKTAAAKHLARGVVLPELEPSSFIVLTEDLDDPHDPHGALGHHDGVDSSSRVPPFRFLETFRSHRRRRRRRLRSRVGDGAGVEPTAKTTSAQAQMTKAPVGQAQTGKQTTAQAPKGKSATGRRRPLPASLGSLHTTLQSDPVKKKVVSFNVKNALLRPLQLAAAHFAMAYGDFDHFNSYERFENLVKAKQMDKDLSNMLVEALKTAFKLRWHLHMQSSEEDDTLEPSTLVDKLAQLRKDLLAAFAAVRCFNLYCTAFAAANDWTVFTKTPADMKCAS